MIKNTPLALSEILASVKTASEYDDRDILSLTQDSRLVGHGCLFVALKGTQQHGIAYAKLAEDQGAVAILWESDESVTMPECSIPLIEVPNLRKYLGMIANRFYGSPSQSLNMVGITGTDGKTSVSHFIAQAVTDCAVIGTIGLGTLNNLKKATHTTPDVLSVHESLFEMKEQGISTVAMEVSSHALDQGRVDNVDFDIAVLTNLSRDHLDYHKTEEAYADAKEKLFAWKSLKAIVINLDDSFGQKIVKTGGGVHHNSHLKVIAYGIGKVENYPKGTLVASESSFSSQGIKAEIQFENEQGELSVEVLGRFNLSNLLAGIGVLLAMGDDLSSALTKIAKVRTVAGRMEKVADGEFLTVVDFAHTPNALLSVLKALREHTQKNLICVFGCGGDRDTGKRPLMAAVAEKYADLTIVTDDNPRTESPQKIVEEIVIGFNKPSLVLVEHDREKAIRLALTKAEKGDVVLIAGKGHESMQILATGSVVFNDYDCANKVLQELAA